MSLLTIKINTDGLKEIQERAAQALQSEDARNDLALVGGRAVASLVKKHLFELDSRGNQLGGVRTHFYSEAAKSVEQPAAVGGVASFLISKVGLAQRWLGGTIKAGAGISSASGGPTRYLAIPARSESYGTVPSEYNDLQFVPRQGGKAMLVQALQTTITVTGSRGGKKKLGQPGARVSGGTERGGLVMFWLVPEVTQKPDPSVMPTEAEMAAAAAEQMQTYLTWRVQTATA